jgi:anti-sigma regulatory factor (Ser/Thr protein kinase)
MHAHTDRDRAADQRIRASAQRAEESRRGRSGPGIMVELEPGASAASEARAALTALDGRIDRDVLDDIRLLVSELVTNSVRHSGTGGGATVRLTVASRGPAVRVEVSDGGIGFEPRARSKRMDEAGGWGLHLVERIADRWGVATGRRTRVWFEIER